VLDNLHDEPMCWDALPYRYARRERPDGLWTRFAIR
jgi:predicted transglutaminase-like cysteine proteinase